MKKKWIIVGTLAVVVLGGGYWGYKHFTTKPATSSAITAQVKRGNVEQEITATGTVNYPQSIPLSFQTGGKLIELNVKPGDTVKAGEVLAKIDPTSLQNSVVQSQANLASAEAKMQQLQDNFTAQTMAQAQASLSKSRQEVASAEASLSTSKQSLTTAQQNANADYLNNQVYVAQQNVNLASDALAKAQASGNTSSIQSAQSALSQAQTALINAKNAKDGGAAQALTAAQESYQATQESYQAAQADLASAQAQVNAQEQGPLPGDVQSAQASITSSEAALQVAQSNLADATLTAPTDGVITAVTAQNYQEVGSGSGSGASSSGSSGLITLAPATKTFEVDSTINQADIDQVKVGQKADITLDSAPNQNMMGTVTRVDPQGATTQNVTNYSVTIQMDQPDPLLLAGMNVNVGIIVAQAKDVLTVPSEAIKTIGGVTGVLVPGTPGTGTGANQNAKQSYRKNASNNTGNNANGSSGYTRNKAAGNNANFGGKFVRVVTGLDDGTNVEIKSGLTEGQEVIIGFRSTTTTTNKSSGGFGQGGNNNAGRAMGSLNRAVGGGGHPSGGKSN